MPRLSIIIPLYNRAKLIVETLDSILAQTYEDWECIVVDDGSTDDSLAVAQSYAEKDVRFTVVPRPHDRIKGGNTCRNIGYQMATGNLIYWFDSDDLLHPHALSAIVATADANPNIEFFFVQDVMFALYINLDKIVPKNFSGEVPIPRTFSNKETPFGWLLRHSGFAMTRILVWRRSLLEKSQVFWEEGRIIYQDRDFTWRLLATTTCEGVWVPQYPLVFGRRHAMQHRTDVNGSAKVATIYPSMVELYRHLIDNRNLSQIEKEKYLNGITYSAIRIATDFDTTEVIKDFYISICALPDAKWKHKWKAWFAYKFARALYSCSRLKSFLRLCFFNKTNF